MNWSTHIQAARSISDLRLVMVVSAAFLLAPILSMAQNTDGNLVSQLTNSYLEGEWCSTQTHNNERAYFVFGPDGSYKLGPGSYNFQLVASGNKSDFLALFHRVERVDPESFVTYRHSWKTVFRRGACR